jgi:hypothetical protein
MNTVRGPTIKKSLRKTRLNAQAFLDSAGVGKKIVEFGVREVIFRQGDPSDQIFYFHPQAREPRGRELAYLAGYFAGFLRPRLSFTWIKGVGRIVATNDWELLRRTRFLIFPPDVLS